MEACSSGNEGSCASSLAAPALPAATARRYQRKVDRGWIGDSKASNGSGLGTDLGRWRTLGHEAAGFMARIGTVIPKTPIPAIPCLLPDHSIHSFAGDIPQVPFGLAPTRSPYGGGSAFWFTQFRICLMTLGWVIHAIR